MEPSYAVTWEDPDGCRRSGRLELAGSALLLEGRNRGVPIKRVYPLGSVSGLYLARRHDERLNGRPTLVVDLAGGDTLKIASVAQSGIVAELAGLLSGDPT